MSAIMSGKPIDIADEAVRSWLRLEIYRQAARVLNLPFDRCKGLGLTQPKSEAYGKYLEIKKAKKAESSCEV